MSALGRMLRKRHAGDDALAWNRPGFDSPDVLKLTSPDFVEGAPMPARTAGKGVGDNVSPVVEWLGVPNEAEELVLVIEDPDVPLPAAIQHAVVTGLAPNDAGVGAGELNAGELHGTGRGSFGRTGYQGPRPIAGHGPHRYVFQLFALDQSLVLPSGAMPGTVFEAMEGHVIARGRLTGTYER
ncbi:YbhB/YbcL family Raf kinase inhibitor-like protein [Plantibacter sp. YIM 135249]|uniref:YbhB/YbcL family Raf kinase inhibitor-like protein n=1 Tax=Plantibacter sp. YIM 135249 TaxID=3423918 RepID=UPI003D334F28